MAGPSELATLIWVHWFNNDRLHSATDYRTPVEHENAYYRQNSSRSSRCRENPASTETGAVHCDVCTTDSPALRVRNSRSFIRK